MDELSQPEAAAAKRTVSVWLDAIELAGKEEEPWYKRAEKVVEKYEASKDESRSRFNILYSNTQTITAAVYNSQPIPDIRPRFADRENQAATKLSQVLERCLSTMADLYGLDDTLEEAVMDTCLAGRGVIRVRYEPTPSDDGQVYKAVTCERVDWRDFRRGPGKRWADVPWVGFQLHLTRGDLEKLVLGGADPAAPDYQERIDLARSIPMDSMSDEARGKYTDKDCPEEFKRACVWEVWDRTEAKVVFVAKGADRILREEPDPLGIEGFFPIPDPLYAIHKTNNLVPVEPYRLYQDQADELDEISRRIQSLAKAIKWRGIRAAGITGLDDLDDAEDGTFLPAGDDLAVLMNGGGLDKAIWMFPTEQATVTLKALTEHRESIKQTIYEITGLSDILRGASEAQETATAQQIKSQWGSLRIRKVQADVQAMVRDLFRLKVEVIANKFDAMNLQLMSGMQVDEQMMALLKQDVVRNYRIDIETDSTIRGDVMRQQEQMNLFLTGSAQFMQGSVVALQSGMIPPDLLITVYAAFARSFKLGKQVEDALDDYVTKARMAAQQPSQPPQPDPTQQAKLEQTKAQTEAIQVKAQADMQKTGMDMQAAQAKHAMDMEKLAFQAANPPLPPGPQGVAQ